MLIPRRENTVEYPSRANYTVYYVYSKGVCLTMGRLDDVLANTKENNLADLKSKYTVEKEFLSKEFGDQMNKYNDEERKINGEWKQELFNMYGTKHQKINELLYVKAWDDAHSDGYYAIETAFDDLADLAIDIINAYNASKED